MVHTGFSRGCDRCRDKHLKCDQARPECTKCVSQAIPCPGYQNQGGFLFKDESAKVIRNGKQRHARRTSSKTGSTVEATSRSASQSHDDSTVHLASLNAAKVAHDPEYNRLHFFLETFAMFNRNIPINQTDLDTIAIFYQNADSASPLLPVLSQVAGELLLLYRRMPDDSPWHLRSRVEASKAMRVALCDPIQRRKNETLLALILLDLGERIEYARTLTPSSVEHHIAAMALVSERGPESFRDYVSQCLLDATRYSVLQKALWANQDDVNMGVFNRAETSMRTNYTMALDQIIARVLNLRKQVSVCLRGEHRNSIQVWDRLHMMSQDLESQLLVWVQNIPGEWYPSLQPNPGLETFSRDRELIEVYYSHEIAFVYNQWRCVNILLLGVAQLLPSQKPVILREKAQTFCEAILSAAPYFFGKPRRRADFQLYSHQEAIFEINDSHTKRDRLGHWNLFELLQWMLRILLDIDYGIAVNPKIALEAKEFLSNLWI